MILPISGYTLALSLSPSLSIPQFFRSISPIYYSPSMESGRVPQSRVNTSLPRGNNEPFWSDAKLVVCSRRAFSSLIVNGVCDNLNIHDVDDDVY